MKVSIIVPVYNAAQFIPRCLQSILFQEYEDWECIVVDDGSTDDSWSRIQEICANDPRFILLQQENRGVSNARNAGISLANGDAICFVDSDDWCEPRMLARMADAAERNPGAGRIITQSKVHYPSGLVDLWLINPLGELPATSPHLFASSTCDAGHVTGSLYVVKNIPLELRFPKVRLFEDMIFNMGLIFAGVTSFVSYESVYHYTRREGSLISSAPFSKADGISCRAALNYLKSLWSPPDDVFERCERFLANAINGRIRR